LPEPLPHPAHPGAAAYIQDPNQLAERLGPWLAREIDPRHELRTWLTGETTPEVAGWIAEAADPHQVWAAVRQSETENIVLISVDKSHLSRLNSHLGGLRPVGKFGARELPLVATAEQTAVSKAPWMIWIDERSGALALAHSERGLVTVRGFKQAYGAAPLFLAVDPDEISLPIPAIPFERFTAQGSLEDLALSLDVGPDFDPGSELADGALSGLLHPPDLALGGSSRWKASEKLIDQLLGEVDRQVDRAPFLVKGLATDMARKLGAAARSWDGRFLIGSGPPGHLRAAYGAEDPKKSGIAVLRLLDTAIDNLDLFRNFASEIPKVHLKKHVADAAGDPIHLLTVSGLERNLPSELRPLVDEKNRLRVAMAWSVRAGGGLMVAGADAEQVLATWLETSAKHATGNDSRSDRIAVRVAIAPAALHEIAGGKSENLLKVGSEAKGYFAVVKRTSATRFEAKIKLADSH
jgi:hypothetical protein